MAKEGFLASLQSLFDQPKYSDFTVTCAGREWKVHKVVICPQSAFFAKACDGDFMEAKSDCVDLKDDPDDVNTMIKFLYTFEYDDKDVPDHDHMPFAIRAFIIADKYDIEPLKKQATERFEALTDYPPCGDGFSCAVNLIYENTLDSGVKEQRLRMNAVSYAWARYHALVKNDKGFKGVLYEVPGFSSDMVASQMERRALEGPGIDVGTIRQCDYCATTFEVLMWLDWKKKGDKKGGTAGTKTLSSPMYCPCYGSNI